MESAILGVILDSSLVIEAERQHFNVAQFLKLIVQKLGEREAALSSITVAELVHGIYRANTEDRRALRRARAFDPAGAIGAGRVGGTGRDDDRRVLALRTILVNLLLASAKKEPMSAAELRALIERADAGKWERARQTVAQPRAASTGGDWVPEFSVGGKNKAF